MPRTIPPFSALKIVNKDGTMTEPFRLFISQMALAGVFEGTGSPDGVVEALPTQLYMDNTGASGSILYVKRDAAIAGDKTKGWVVV